MARRNNVDRVLMAVAWMQRREGQPFRKVDLAAGIGLGPGDNFERVYTAARRYCAVKGWCLTYCARDHSGGWRCLFTKTDAKAPLPGVATRTKSIASQNKGVLTQIEFMNKHAQTVDQRALAEVMQTVTMNTIETNALVRSLIDRFLSTDPDTP